MLLLLLQLPSGQCIQETAERPYSLRVAYLIFWVLFQSGSPQSLGPLRLTPCARNYTGLCRLCRPRPARQTRPWVSKRTRFASRLHARFGGGDYLKAWR